MKNILLVEDAPDVLAIFKIIIEELGYKVTEFNNADDAIKNLSRNDYDLIITDINLGLTSGLEIVKWSNQHKPDTKVIIITGDLHEVDAKDAIDLGCHAFLAKPVDNRELKSVLLNTLGDHNIEPSDFAKIPLDDFICGNVVNFPVYLNLSDGRFIKFAHTGVEIDIERLSQLRENGVKELWLSKEDFPSYLKMCDKILEAMGKHKKWTHQAKNRLRQHTTDITLRNFESLELSPQLIQVGLENINSFVDEISKINGVAKYVVTLMNNFPDQHRRATNCSVLASLCAQVMGWSSQRNIDNLVMGSYLRDIGMIQVPEHLREVNPSNMSAEDFQMYSQHPIYAHNMLSDVDEINEEVLKIVLEHHEIGDSKSFPLQKDRKSLFPMSKIVYVINRFVEQMDFAKKEESFDKKYIQAYICSNEESPEASHALRCLLKEPSLNKACDEYKKKF